MDIETVEISIPKTQEIRTDIEFKKCLKQLSGSSLNECMQCGTCSAVCTLSPEESPFPRKEMIWAGWGLKERLLGDGDLWLCYQCGDCTAYCPRGVKPADVLAAVREMNYRHYARPQFLGKMLSNPAWLPVALLIPVVVITAILLMAGTFSIPEGQVDYSAFFPHAWLNGSFSLITLFFYLQWSFGLGRFWKDMKERAPGKKTVLGIIKSSFHLKNKLLLHDDFRKCTARRSRWMSHMLVFYGFIMLLVVTVFAILAVFMDNYPMGFLNPVKIAGNVAGLMLITGITMMILNRIFNKELYGKSNYSDWLLLVSLLVLTISGLVVEIARFQNWHLAYHLYFFHLVCVWFVVMYLPYTKFGHMVYRWFAMTFAIATGRK